MIQFLPWLHGRETLTVKPQQIDPSLSDSEKCEHRTRIEQDEAFCRAMARTVAAGWEHPPMLGIDTRPGTSRPQIMTR